MPTPLTFDIFLDTTGPMAPCRLLTSADSSQPAVLPALVQADKLTVRLWLVVPATTIGAAATTLTHTGTIALAIKADQSDADMLALCTSFTSATVDGRTVYTGTLNLNTDAMATAFTSPSIDTINAWFDVELSNGTNRQTFQNRVAIYREVYTGTQPPPEALPEWPMPADIPNKPSADGYGRIVVKDGADGLLKLSKLAFNLLSPGVVELASSTASTLSISEPTLRIGALTASSSTTELSIGNAACHTDMLGEFDFTAATTNSLVRYDAAQTLTSGQQAQARANIGVLPHGGVSASSGTTAPAATVTVPDFEAWFICPSATSGTLLKITHGGGDYNVAVGDSRFGSALYRGIGYVASTGVLTLYADGVAHATTTALTAGNVTLANVLNAATCTLVGGSIFNRALDSNERASVVGGTVPAALAVCAKQFGTSGANNSTIFLNPFDTYSYTGTTLSVAQTTTGAQQSASLAKVYRGGAYRISGNVTSNNITGLSFAIWRSTDGDGGQVVAIPASGAFSIDLSLTIASAPYGEISILANPAGTPGNSATITNLRVEAIGTIARYEPENVTSLGRWLDSSGNGYDLIPGSGITPLKPQPVQVRMEECLYDLGSSVAADAPAGWTLAKTGTGILTMTPPAYVKAIKPPVVTANSANGGYTVDTAVNQSTGVVTITSRNGGTPADSVLYIHISHRE